MKNKNARLDAIKLIISTQEIGGQEELLGELSRAGFALTQATLSRDLKQLKVAKAANSAGHYVYVLPNNTMYRRTVDTRSLPEALLHTGFVSIKFSGNLAVLKTRPGYASRMAFDIDNGDIPNLLGTVAGDDTILLILVQGTDYNEIKRDLQSVIPDIR